MQHPNYRHRRCFTDGAMPEDCGNDYASAHFSGYVCWRCRIELDVVQRRRTATNFCRQPRNFPQSLNHGHPGWCRLWWRYERLSNVAPLAVKKVWKASRIWSGGGVDATDPASVQAVADVVCHRRSSGGDWVRDTCEVDISTGISATP